MEGRAGAPGGPVAGVTPGRPYLRLAVLAVLLVGVVVALRVTPLGEVFSRDAMLAVFERLRGSAWAPAAFILLYAGATALALPGSILTIVGGAVFGFWYGAILNTLAANLGANAAFGVARALGREGIRRLAGRRLQGLDRATRDRGFAGLFVLRLIPLVPFNALNFGAGLTAIRWRDYALATAIGILPGTLVYTFFADALVRGSAEAGQDARLRLWIAVGLLLLLSAIPLIARRFGFTFGAREQPDEDS